MRRFSPYIRYIPRPRRIRRKSSSTAILFLFLITLASGFILGSSVKKGFAQKIQSKIVSKIKQKEKEAEFDGKLVLFKEPEPTPPLPAPKPKIFRSNYVQRRYVVDEPRWVQRRYVSQDVIEETTIPPSSSRDRGTNQ